jgi:hypothetical protein
MINEDRLRPSLSWTGHSSSEEISLPYRQLEYSIDPIEPLRAAASTERNGVFARRQRTSS